MRKEQMTESDLKRVESQFGISGCAAIIIPFIFVLLYIFIGGKGNRPTLFQQYGFFEAFLKEGLIIFGLFGIAYWQIYKGKRKDLSLKEKVVEELSIKNKEYFTDFGKKKQYRLFTHSDIKEFKTILVDKDSYDLVEKNEIITLEYAPNTKVLLRIFFKGNELTFFEK